MTESSEQLDTADAAAYLAGIEEVRIVPYGSKDDVRQQYDPEIYETITDIISEHRDYDELFEILNEAYYSIDYDYWISYYLQWHRYGLNGDPFAPNF